MRELPKPVLPQRAKPKAITRAEYALLTWTAWTCFFGIYQTWTEIPDFEKAMSQQLQGMMTISPATLMQYTVGGYALVAVVSVFFVYAIGKGKRWARASFMAGLVFEALCSVLWIFMAGAFGASEGWQEYLADIPDYGLQVYALYLLYTWPGDQWFHSPQPQPVE